MNSTARSLWPEAGTLALLLLAAGLTVYVRLAAATLPGPEWKPYYEDEAGSTYLYNKDPYYHLRLSRELLETGELGPRDDLSFAPAGRPLGPTLLPRLQAAAYRALGGRVPLMEVAFHLPVALEVLTTLLIFLLGRLALGTQAGAGGGTLAGLVAALLYALHPEVVAHTHAGIADTDALILLCFSLAGAGFLLALAGSRRGRWKGAAGGALLALGALGLLAAAWRGYPILAGILGAALILHAVLALLDRRGWRRRRIVVLAALLALLGFATLLLADADFLARARAYTTKGTHLFFPAGLEEVSELQTLSATALLARLGGFALVLLPLLGLPSLLRERPSATVFLLVWLLPLALLGRGAVRFLVYAVPPLLVLAGASLVLLGDTLVRDHPRARSWVRAGLGALAVLLFAWSAAPRLEAIGRRLPPVDRAFAEVAREVRRETPADAILNVWWDEGHLWAALTGRGVILDGGTFQTPRLYWFSRALSAEDEDRAAGLLRLVDCGREEDLFAALLGWTGRPRAVETILALARLEDRDAWRDYLLGQGFPARDLPAVLEILDCRPPEGLLLLTSDLLPKTASWSRYARWDFRGPPPPLEARLTAPVPCGRRGSLLECADGYRLNLAADPHRQRGGPGHFAVVGEAGAEGLVPVIYQEGEGLLKVDAGPEVVDSLFGRLFFFRGGGRDEPLRRFEPLAEAFHPPYTRRVAAWRVRW